MVWNSNMTSNGTQGGHADPAGWIGVGHNSPRDLLVLWILPNGAWLVVPGILIYVFGRDSPSQPSASLNAQSPDHCASPRRKRLCSAPSSRSECSLCIAGWYSEDDGARDEDDSTTERSARTSRASSPRRLPWPSLTGHPQVRIAHARPLRLIRVCKISAAQVARHAQY